MARARSASACEVASTREKRGSQARSSSCEAPWKTRWAVAVARPSAAAQRCVKHALHVVQIEHRARADRRQSAPGRARTRNARSRPDRSGAPASARAICARKAREAVHQRRHAPHHASRIAQRAGGETAPVGRQVQHGDAADQAGGDQRRGIGRSRLAEDDDIDVVAARQVLQQRSGAQRPAPGKRVRRFRREEESGGPSGMAWKPLPPSGSRARRRAPASATSLSLRTPSRSRLRPADAARLAADLSD